MVVATSTTVLLAVVTSSCVDVAQEVYFGILECFRYIFSSTINEYLLVIRGNHDDHENLGSFWGFAHQRGMAPREVCSPDHLPSLSIQIWGVRELDKGLGYSCRSSVTCLGVRGEAAFELLNSKSVRLSSILVVILGEIFFFFKAWRVI